MKGIHNYFSISSFFDNRNDINFEDNAFLLHGSAAEERSIISDDFRTLKPSLQVIEIVENSNESISLTLTDGNKQLSLRSTKDFNELVDYLEGLSIYLDMTGLTHSTWAWLVKVILFRTTGQSFVLYSEPKEYCFSDSPVEGQFFDLSKRIGGISPLPGFAKFFKYQTDNFIFMPLLGFEGTRLSHLWEDIQPLSEFTFPVFGIPGFRHDYPFYSYQGNKVVLMREEIWRNWKYEQANCPVSIYIMGSALLKRNPEKVLRIAPIGTKPHALGAILLKLINPSRVDLIYDHPTRQAKRTTGRFNTICYKLDPFKNLVVKS